MALQQGPQVRGILLQIGAQVDQLARLIPLQGLLRGEVGLEQRVGQRLLAREHGCLGRSPLLGSGVLRQHGGNTGNLLHAFEEEVVVPVVSGRLVVISGHAESSLGICTREHQQHDQREKKRPYVQVTHRVPSVC